MSEKLVNVVFDKINGYGVMLPEGEAKKAMPKVEEKQVTPVENKMVEPAEDKAVEKPVAGKRKTR